MGLLMTRLLALSPASAIWGIGRRPQSRAAAAAGGATHLFAPDDPGLLAGSVDVVVEATGSQAGLDIASRLAAEHGVLSILGYHQGAHRTVDMRDWNWKSLTVINAHVRDRHWLASSTLAAMRLVAADRFDIAELFTHHYTLDQLNDAYQALRDKPAGFVKAIVDVEGRDLLAPTNAVGSAHPRPHLRLRATGWTL